ncbi:hypothetical protein ACFQX6_05495 [Streptosporangium lutulentum]
MFALCSATSDAVIEATAFNVPASGRRGAVAECPSGRRVTGGGVGTPTTPVNDYILISGPLDASGTTAGTSDGDVARYWYAHAYNFDSWSSDRVYKVFALCSS